MKKYTPVVALVLILPLVAYAQEGKLEGLILYAAQLVEYLISLVAAIALLVFMWGLAVFIFKIGGDEKAIAQGKALMKWGLIALFVMLSVWGIIRFFQGELGLDTSPLDIVNIISK